MKFSMDALRKRGVVGLAIPLIFSFYLELFVGTEAQAGECQRALSLCRTCSLRVSDLKLFERLKTLLEANPLLKFQEASCLGACRSPVSVLFERVLYTKMDIAGLVEQLEAASDHIEQVQILTAVLQLNDRS